MTPEIRIRRRSCAVIRGGFGADSWASTDWPCSARGEVSVRRSHPTSHVRSAGIKRTLLYVLYALTIYVVMVVPAINIGYWLYGGREPALWYVVAVPVWLISSFYIGGGILRRVSKMRSAGLDQ